MPSPLRGRGAHNIEDKLFHIAKTKIRTRIFKNPIARTLVRIAILESRKHGASINDISDIFDISTRTVSKIIDGARGLRPEPAFNMRIPRLKKYCGRVDLKVKLSKMASRLWFCIRAILARGFNDIERAIMYILGQSDEPP
ncbi:MAG: helix-turn-helix domain-containing protein [Nitrososphaerales archaeon]